jgi:hypothetical protein
LAILGDAPPRRRESFAKRAWFRGATSEEDFRPGREPTIVSAESFLLRESANRMYRKGERGQPYLMPFWAWKKLEG